MMQLKINGNEVLEYKVEECQDEKKVTFLRLEIVTNKGLF